MKNHSIERDTLTGRLWRHVARFARRAFRYRGLSVLILWQAPVGPVVGPDGSISLVFGAGTDEITDLDCNGELIDSYAADYAIAAIEVEHDVADRVRLEAAGGNVFSDSRFHDGGFGALRLRADWTNIGIGGGGALVRTAQFDDNSVTLLPSLYLRLGGAETLHLRADLLQPTAQVPQQIARAGVGWNATRRDLTSGFVGIAALGSDEGVTGITADIAVPLTDRLGFSLAAQYAPGRRTDLHGIWLGGRLLVP